MYSNFTFLEHEFPILYYISNTAESYVHQDPVYCLAKLRSFGEKLTELLFTEHALDFPVDNSFHNRLKTLTDEKLLPFAVKDLLFLIKKKGNVAVHDNEGSFGEAKQGLSGALTMAK